MASSISQYIYISLLYITEHVDIKPFCTYREYIFPFTQIPQTQYDVDIRFGTQKHTLNKHAYLNPLQTWLVGFQ